jgi:uncharacterized membrane protein
MAEEVGNAIRQTRVKKFLAHGRADFPARLAVALPVAVSLAVVLWLFGTVFNLTDTLLLLVPQEWVRYGQRPPHLYSRVFALLLAMLLIGLVRTGAAPGPAW